MQTLGDLAIKNSTIDRSGTGNALIKLEGCYAVFSYYRL